MKRYKSPLRPSTLLFAVTVTVVAFYAISSNPQHAFCKGSAEDADQISYEVGGSW
jgi:hypothetical protein